MRNTINPALAAKKMYIQPTVTISDLVFTQTLCTSDNTGGGTQLGGTLNSELVTPTQL